MPYSLQLFFDPVSDAAVRGIWADLAQKKISSSMQDNCYRPHVSLMGMQDASPGFAAKAARWFENAGSFTLNFNSWGVFTGANNVVYLAPVTHRPLLALHQQAHDILGNDAIDPVSYYQPGQWTPHCTLGVRMNAAELGAAVSFLTEISLPLTAQVTRAALVEGATGREVFIQNLAEAA